MDYDGFLLVAMTDFSAFWFSRLRQAGLLYRFPVHLSVKSLTFSPARIQKALQPPNLVLPLPSTTPEMLPLAWCTLPLSGRSGKRSARGGKVFLSR